MRAKQWIILAVWFACYIAALEFFRFKFGVLKISAIYVIVGILLVILTGRSAKEKSN